MNNIDLVEKKIRAKYDSNFKNFIKSIGNKKVRFHALNVVFQFLDFTKSEYDDIFDNPFFLSSEMSAFLIRNNEEVEGTIVMPIARGTIGDRFDFLYLIKLPNEKVASPNIYYRNSDRTVWERVKIGNDIQLFIGNYNDIFESIYIEKYEKFLFFEAKTRKLLLDLETPKQITQYNKGSKKEGHKVSKLESTHNLDDSWKIDFYIDIWKHKDQTSSYVVLIPISTIQVGNNVFRSTVPYIDTNSKHVSSYEYGLVHNTYPWKRMVILLTLKKQIEYIESLNIVNKEVILELIDKYSLHAICEKWPSDVVTSFVS